MTYTSILTSTNELLQILNHSQIPFNMMVREELHHCIPDEFSVGQRVNSICTAILQNNQIRQEHPIRFQATQLLSLEKTEESTTNLLTQIKYSLEELSIIRHSSTSSTTSTDILEIDLIEEAEIAQVIELQNNALVDLIYQNNFNQIPNDHFDKIQSGYSVLSKIDAIPEFQDAITELWPRLFELCFALIEIDQIKNQKMDKRDWTEQEIIQFQHMDPSKIFQTFALQFQDPPPPLSPLFAKAIFCGYKHREIHEKVCCFVFKKFDLAKPLYHLEKPLTTLNSPQIEDLLFRSIDTENTYLFEELSKAGIFSIISPETKEICLTWLFNRNQSIFISKIFQHFTPSEQLFFQLFEMTWQSKNKTLFELTFEKYKQNYPLPILFIRLAQIGCVYCFTPLKIYTETNDKKIIYNIFIHAYKSNQNNFFKKLILSKMTKEFPSSLVQNAFDQFLQHTNTEALNFILKNPICNQLNSESADHCVNYLMTNHSNLDEFSDSFFSSPLFHKISNSALIDLFDFGFRRGDELIINTLLSSSFTPSQRIYEDAFLSCIKNLHISCFLTYFNHPKFRVFSSELLKKYLDYATLAEAPELIEQLLLKGNIGDLNYLKNARTKNLNLHHFKNASVLWKKIRQILIDSEQSNKRRRIV